MLCTAGSGRLVREALPEVDRGQGAVRAPRLGDPLELGRGRAARRARRRPGPPCGSRGRRSAARRGARGRRSGTSARSRRRSPRTAVISAITSSSESWSRRSSSSSPETTCSARSRTYSTLRQESPTSRSALRLDLEQLLGRRRRAAEQVQHPAVDRRRGLDGELLADDAAQQHPVGVDRRASPAPRLERELAEARRSAAPSPGPSREPGRRCGAHATDRTRRRGCATGSLSCRASAHVPPRLARARPCLDADGAGATLRRSRCTLRVPATSADRSDRRRPRLIVAGGALLALGAGDRRWRSQPAAAPARSPAPRRRRSRTSSCCSPTTRSRARCG